MLTGVISRKGVNSPMRAKLSLIALPLLFVMLSGRLANDRGPFWLGTNSDPSYQYLFSSLLMANGIAPHHTDHPGTPVQSIGYLVLSATNSRDDMQAFNDAVLTRPEESLQRIQSVLMAIAVLALVAAGLLVLHSTRSLLIALSVQATPLLQFETYQATLNVAPEILLVSITVLLVALIIVMECDAAATAQKRRLYSIALGVIAGVGIASKITFAPVCLLALAIQPSWRLAILALAAMVISTAACLAPIWTEIPRMLSWFTGLAGHKGIYADGEVGFVDWNAYPRNLLVMLTSDWLMLGVIAGSALVGLRTRGTRAGRLLIAVTVVQFAGLALIAKHPSARYGMPIAITTALNVALMLRIAATSGVRVSKPVPFAIGAAALVLGFYYTRRAAELRTFAREQLAMKVAAESLGVRVDYYQASSREFALHFGNGAARFLFSSNLLRLYPGRLFLNRMNGNFEMFAGWIRPAAISREQPLMLHGTPFAHPVMQGWKAAPVLTGERTAIYRVEWLGFTDTDKK